MSTFVSVCIQDEKSIKHLHGPYTMSRKYQISQPNIVVNVHFLCVCIKRFESLQLKCARKKNNDKEKWNCSGSSFWYILYAIAHYISTQSMCWITEYPNIFWYYSKLAFSFTFRFKTKLYTKIIILKYILKVEITWRFILYEKFWRIFFRKHWLYLLFLP